MNDSLQPKGACVPGEGEWSWWASRDEESYTVGPCGSRDEAIQTALEDFEDDPFHIVEACKGSMSAYLPSGSRILEWMTETADDEGAFGEDQYCELTGKATAIAAAEADVAAVLAEWFSRHANIFPTPWAFRATRNGEWVTPAIAKVAKRRSEPEMNAPDMEAVEALIERLDGLSASLGQPDAAPPQVYGACVSITQAAEALRALLSAYKERVEALEPFGRAVVGKTWPDNTPVKLVGMLGEKATGITAGDLRRARALTPNTEAG